MIQWLKRLIYAQHNASVLADMEYRFGVVLDAATGGMLSKPYYDTQTMLDAVTERQQASYNDGYKDGTEDFDGYQ